MDRTILEPTVYIAGDWTSATNRRLRTAFVAAGARALVGRPEIAARARPGDVVVGRLDVRPTLDGVQPGLARLLQARMRGVRVVNDADALVGMHDKLATTRLLAAAGVTQPYAMHARDEDASPVFDPPYVVKPRFGSWGRDVHRCGTRAHLRSLLRVLRDRPWFKRHGALVQELITPRGYDLRLVVAAGSVIGAVERVAAPGEWRTNIALGGSRRRTIPPPGACELAIAAARAVGGELVGVDLVPESWQVIEVNGAVDFTDEYSLCGRGVFARAVEPFLPDVVFEAVPLAAGVMGLGA